MSPYIAEFIGTALLVFLGESVNAANSLKGGSNWSYALVPVIGPLFGAVIGAELGILIFNINSI